MRSLAGPANGPPVSCVTRRPACGSGRPGVDALQASSRARKCAALGGPAVLEGGLGSIAEHLAAVDAGPQLAPSRRKTMPPAVMVCMSDCYPGMRAMPPAKCAYIDSYRQGGCEARLLVDRCRLVSLRRRLDKRRHVGARPAALSQGPSRRGRPRPAGGMKLVVWFEPERVTRARGLNEHHPEWVLGAGEAGC